MVPVLVLEEIFATLQSSQIISVSSQVMLPSDRLPFESSKALMLRLGLVISCAGTA